MESPLPGAAEDERPSSTVSNREEVLEMQRKRLQRKPMSIMVQPSNARAAAGRTLSTSGRRPSETALLSPTRGPSAPVDLPPTSPAAAAAAAAAIPPTPEITDLTKRIAQAGFGEYNPDETRFVERSISSPAASGPATPSRRLSLARVSLPSGQQFNAEEFVCRPAPMGELIQCVVSRDKSGMDKMHPVYYLKLQRKDDEAKVFLLAGRKRKYSKTSNYLISLDATDLKRDGEAYLAKLRGNFVGTGFTIYDDGRNPSKADGPADKPVRRELGLVSFEKNVFGLKGPRKMTVVLPAISDTGLAVDFQPTREEDTLAERLKAARVDDMLVLHNKQPVWNAETQSHVLNFGGRVTQASVKNFQIVHESDPNYIIMQFGRIDDDEFTMDFRYPMSAVQAFAIALSSFDGKLAVE